MPLLDVIWVAGMLGLFVGYFCSAFKMVKGRREGVQVFDARLAWNPLNLCFRPALLSEEGLNARKWFFGYLFGFFAWIGLAAVLGHWMR